MSEMFEKIVDSKIVQCDGVCRWVPKFGSESTMRKLQQRYLITTFKNGNAVSREEEWRDVPFVNE